MISDKGSWQQAAGLLALRIVIPGSLILKHGIEKVFTFSTMAQHFPDPIHIGPVPQGNRMKESIQARPKSSAR
jgi:hypothetical protein